MDGRGPDTQSIRGEVGEMGDEEDFSKRPMEKRPLIM